jgi:hypothetical protein
MAFLPAPHDEAVSEKYRFDIAWPLAGLVAPQLL